MKRFGLIFLVAIFLPSLVLGWLALRTAKEQRVILERQAAELHQGETDALAGAVREAVFAREEEFDQAVLALLGTMNASALAEDYGSRLPEPLRNDGVPFVVSPQGALVFPAARKPAGNVRVREFLEQNSAFLSNRVTAEVYPAQQAAAPIEAPEERDRQEKDESKEIKVQPPRSAPAPAAARSALDASAAFAAGGSAAGVPQTTRKAGEQAALKKQVVTRNVMPQKMRESTVEQAAPLSKIEASLSDFQTAIKDGTKGILSRFVQNDLELLMWTRPAEARGYVFGIALSAERLREFAGKALAGAASKDGCLAVLDENARPVAKSSTGFETAWKRPFVSTEVGEVLPHWEAALYLLDPDKLNASARLVTLTLILLIALALAAILAGGYFVAWDTRRQLGLAQKKSDFVSNVSHELKTPLTSIRMFAELLHSGKVRDPVKHDKYLKIIMDESERLTRLINNVLDFTRMEKRRMRYEKRVFDFNASIERLWEGHAARLREAGFSVDWEREPAPYEVNGDEDALCQVVVNLLSNAEKYSIDGRKEVTLRTGIKNGQICIAVLDRGIGVPRGQERRIFDAFYRAYDSLGSGVQGSGLGLTLALRIAQEHGGAISHEPRPGGGSVFSLVLPAAIPAATDGM